MAKGWDPIQQQAADVASRRELGGDTYLPDLRIGEKTVQPIAIRFLEQGQDVNSFWTHEYKVPNNSGGRPWVKRFTCYTEIGWSNTQCPGCIAGLPRKARGVFNLIQRNRPVLRKGADGKAAKDGMGQYIVDGWQDAVVVANVGGPTSNMIRSADANYGGLMSRDFVVSYSGDTFQSWSMAPSVDSAGNAMATPMSDADLQLAASKHNLDEYMKPPELQKAQQIVQMYAANSGAKPPAGGAGIMQPPPTPGAPPQAPGLQQNQFMQGVDPAVVNAFAAATGQPQQPAQQAPPAPPQQQPPAPQQQPPQPVQQPQTPPPAPVAGVPIQ